MKISIITATLNNEKTIDDCLTSIKTQTHNNIEQIIVDGLSTDSTLKIVDKHANQNFIIISEPDKGIYDALNKGIKMATGDIIGILHADDFYATNDILSKISQCFEKHECDILYGNLEYIDQSPQQKTIRYWKAGIFTAQKLKNGWMPPHPTLFVKKEVYQQIGLFNITYKIAADYDFMIRCLKNPEFKIHYLPQTIVKMRIGGKSNKSVSNIIQKSKEDYQIIKANRIGDIRTLVLKNIGKIHQFFR